MMFLKKDGPVRKEFLFLEKASTNPFLKLFYIIQKNLKLVLRSKISALIFIFGPLLIISLAALAFNTSTLHDLNIATYSESYSDMSESIITNLTNSQYNVQKLESEPDCIDGVKFGDYHVCIVFPSNLVLDNSENNVIKIYVDNSRINIANLISSQITTKVAVESSSLSTEIVTQILTALDTANTESTQTSSILNTAITDNNEMKSTIDSSYSSTSSIDLSYTTIDTAAIDTELSLIQSAHNISSTELTNLNTIIDTLQTSYSSMASKMTTASDTIITLNTNLPTLSAQVSTTTTKLQEANTNINSVTSSIDEIKVTNVNSIVTPIKTSIEPISSTNSYLLYILPSILVLLIMFVALLMSSSAIITEKESRAYFRNFITPTNGLLFLIGEFLTNMIILTFQITLMLFVLYLFFGGMLDKDILLLTGLGLVVIAIFFVLMGMLFGYLFSTKQTVTLASISAGIIMLFFSNTILPLETLSQYFRDIVYYNPFVIGESMLKKIILFYSTFSGISGMIYTLLILCGILFILVILARYSSKTQQNQE